MTTPINPQFIPASDGPPPKVRRISTKITQSAWRRYPKKVTAPAVRKEAGK